MGQLAAYLQHAFQTQCPPGWHSQAEVPLLSADLHRLFGYAPQVDVLLTHEDGRRLWIEFEISRADPVANHAKFATTHLFQPQPPSDLFLSMVTAHVARGRRNLAANTIWLMRYAGLQAYQTPLLPHLPPAEIKRLNHLDEASLAQEKLPVKAELQRILTISAALTHLEEAAIHFVANHMELTLNLHHWNDTVLTEPGRSLWGRRTVTYFVYDPVSHHFAPSKFCAYVSIPTITAITLPISGATMTLERYAQIDHGEPIFDGHRAHRHLTNNLALTLVAASERPALLTRFQRWHKQYQAAITVHPAGPKFLIPPAWV